jgi:hypothetical protein
MGLIMRKIKRYFIRLFLIFLIIIPVASFGHFFFFPQETRSLLVDFSDFHRDGKLYFNAKTSESEIDSLRRYVKEASTRVTKFWGRKISNSKFIYCEKQTDFERYSVSPSAPAVTYLKFGSVIVLSNWGLDLDIVAHEICHVELYQRIGFYKFNYRIPSWFKHGLAMQNDYRSYYSEDTFRLKTNNFKTSPDINTLKTEAQFYKGSVEEVMLNYMAAKYAVKRWYTKEKLSKLICDLNRGVSFELAYAK